MRSPALVGFGSGPGGIGRSVDRATARIPVPRKTTIPHRAPGHDAAQRVRAPPDEAEVGHAEGSGPDDEQADEPDERDRCRQARGHDPDRGVGRDTEGDEDEAGEQRQEQGERHGRREDEERRRTRVPGPGSRSALEGLLAGTGDEADAQEQERHDEHRRADRRRRREDRDDEKPEPDQAGEPADEVEAGGDAMLEAERAQAGPAE